MSALKQQVYSYIAGMERAETRADAGSAPQIVNMVSERVERQPDRAVGGIVERKLIFVRGTLALADGEPQQFSAEVFLDRVDGIARGSHVSPSVSASVLDTPDASTATVGDAADSTTSPSGESAAPSGDAA